MPGTPSTARRARPALARIATVVALAGALSACGGSRPPRPPAATTTTTAPPTTAPPSTEAPPTTSAPSTTAPPTTAPPTTQAPPPTLPDNPEGWQLTWSEEWDEPAGTQPSRDRWTYEVGNRDQNAWGNNELQYYTGDPENVATDGEGNLAITARETEAGRDAPCLQGGNCRWTSARIITRDHVTVQTGRIEARMWVPEGVGLWPAFWMLGEQGGWPRGGEIDVMEWIGKDPNVVYGTLHGADAGGQHYGVGGDTSLDQPVSEGFHTFAVDKRPGDIRWFLDGVEYFRVTRDDIPAGAEWPFDQPFYLLLNLAVGGNWPGPPDASTQFPATLLVDYVRIYS